jgi:hypothetical protein
MIHAVLQLASRFLVRRSEKCGKKYQGSGFSYILEVWKMAHPNCGAIITDTHPTVVISANFFRNTVHYCDNLHSTAQTST